MANIQVLKVGDKISAADALEIRLIPVEKNNPMPDGTTITKVNVLDLGRDGYRIIHYGSNTGPMYKNPGNNTITQEVVVTNIYIPQK